jgi:hypothetical protein
MTLIHAKPGQKFRISEIDMEFFYWDGDYPVFSFTINKLQVTYSNKKWNYNTLLTEIK